MKGTRDRIVRYKQLNGEGWLCPLVTSGADPRGAPRSARWCAIPSDSAAGRLALPSGPAPTSSDSASAPCYKLARLCPRPCPLGVTSLSDLLLSPCPLRLHPAVRCLDDWWDVPLVHRPTVAPPTGRSLSSSARPPAAPGQPSSDPFQPPRSVRSLRVPAPLPGSTRSLCPSPGPTPREVQPSHTVSCIFLTLHISSRSGAIRPSSASVSRSAGAPAPLPLALDPASGGGGLAP